MDQGLPQLPLQPKVARQLLRDCSKYPSLGCKPFLSRRKEYCGVYYKAARNRYYYCKRLSRTELSAALDRIGRKDELPTFCSDSDEEEEETRAEETTAEQPTPDTPVSSSPVSFLSARLAAVRIQPGTPQTPAVAPRTTAFSSPAFTMASPEMKAGGTMFTCLEDAIEFADDVVDVDFEYPERNNQGLYICQIDKVETPKELITKLRVLIPDIVDLRDFKSIKGLIVCGGSAFLIFRPSLPFALLNGIDDFFSIEKNPCTRTQQDMKATMTNIRGDKARQFRSILLVFPNDVSLTSDWTDNIPRVDKKSKLNLRIVQLKKHKIDDKGKQAVQYFYPAYWEMRMVIGNRRDVFEGEEEDDDDLAAAMEGQKINL